MRYKTTLITILTCLFATGLAPGADKYEIDVAHSYVGFSIRHLVISNVKGNFTDFSGVIVYDEDDITKSSVTVDIRTSSINTDNEARDNHLRSADFFDAERYPEITFESTEMKETKDGPVMHGHLTIHGVKKEVAVPFEILGKAKGMAGEVRVGFEGHSSLSREDFGMTWNKVMEAGGLLVGNEVKVELQIEAVKK
jgi:polyisoprenoid-binding protein YceI